MKYDQFTSTIAMIHQNLKLALEQKEKQSDELLNQGMKELIDNKDYALVFLSSLETQLKEHGEEKRNHIEALERDITALKQKLEDEIATYRKEHVVDEDKARLLTIKEEKLVEPRARKKKEIQDLNQKITILDKECLQILKENETTLQEEEKNYKQKLLELDRKMKFEVQKIAEAILTPVNNDRQETESSPNDILLDKTKVIETRKNGINEIAKIQLKYYNEMRQIEIAFCNFKYHLKREKGILREEYDQKIEELSFARQNHQLELQKQIDMYDFDTYKSVNMFDKTYRLAENQIRVDSAQNIANAEASVLSMEKSKLEVEHLDRMGIYDQIRDYDLAQLASYHQENQVNHAIIQEMMNKINEFLIDILSTYQHLMTSIVAHFWDIVYFNENQLKQAFVALNYQTNLASQFNRAPLVAELNELLADFSKRQKVRVDEFKHQLNEQGKNLLRQVTVVYRSLTDYMLQEQKNLEEHRQAIELWVKKVNHKANEALLQDHEAQLNTIAQKQNATENKQKAIVDGLADEAKKIEDDYFTKFNHLNDKIDNYQVTIKNEQKKAKQAYLSFIQKSKERISKYKSQYKSECSEELSNIAHKYDNLIRENEIERKTKIKMQQI